jgi:lysozyme
MASAKKTGGIAALCIAAAGACLSLTKSSEGSRLTPYRDPANIVSWCYGETQGPHKDRYNEAECASLLENRLAKVYAPKIAACLPEVADHRINIFAALLDASYNAGPAAVCGSPMAHKLRAGDEAGACGAFDDNYIVEGMLIHGWFASARYRGKPEPAAVMRRHGWTWTGKSWRKELGGLVTRRRKEATLCFAA